MRKVPCTCAVELNLTRIVPVRLIKEARFDILAEERKRARFDFGLETVYEVLYPDIKSQSVIIQLRCCPFE